MLACYAIAFYIWQFKLELIMNSVIDILALSLKLGEGKNDIK